MCNAHCAAGQISADRFIILHAITLGSPKVLFTAYDLPSKALQPRFCQGSMRQFWIPVVWQGSWQPGCCSSEDVVSHVITHGGILSSLQRCSSATRATTACCICKCWSSTGSQSHRLMLLPWLV